MYKKRLRIYSQLKAADKPVNNGQFSDKNYAILFMPGTYNNLDIPIGYYTQVAGLGKTIDSVVIQGGKFDKSSNPTQGPRIDNSSPDFKTGALNNFWRSCENMKIVNPSDYQENTMTWAASQAVSLRNIDLGDAKLSLYAMEPGGNDGFASGGFISNVNAKICDTGSQQQFLCRNCSFSSFPTAVWNNVLAGCKIDNLKSCCQNTDTSHITLTNTTVTKEKPYLVANSSKKFDFGIAKPDIYNGNRIGFLNNKITNINNSYFVATTENSASDINKALSDGKDIVLCPGIYNFDKTLVLSGQLIYGLGIPRLKNTNGDSIISGYGELSGIIFEASESTTTNPPNTSILVNLNDKNPSYLWDVYCRVGGGKSPPNKGNNFSADTMLLVGGDNSIIDNTWCWVADHYGDGTYTGWDGAVCNKGVHITGNNVIAYGIFSEHNHKVNVQWDGDNGQVHFFQSEFNYFPPSQDEFNVYSYQVGNQVKSHSIYGGGAYCFFPCIDPDPNKSIYAKGGFYFPNVNNVNYNTLFTYFLNGYGGIKNLINLDGNSVEYKPDTKSSEKSSFNCFGKQTKNLPIAQKSFAYSCNNKNTFSEPCECASCPTDSIECINGQCPYE